MMLFGEREDDFPEIDLLDNQSKKTEDMSKFETIIGARNAVTGNIEGASPTASMVSSLVISIPPAMCISARLAR